MATNPNHIDRNHPVRAILDRAASGIRPSKRDLDRMLIDVSDEHLPDGQSLDRFREELTNHATQIAAISATGAHGSARTAAQEAAATLARRMTPAQRALNTTMTTESARDVDDIVARVFEN